MAILSVRTTAHTFAALRSSLSNACCQTRFGYLPYLYDTHLEPAHVGIRLLSIVGMLAPPLAGGRTSGFCRHHLLCLLSRLIRLSRNERPDGSQPAYACRDVAFWRNGYLPRYRAAFAFSIVLYPTPHGLTLRLAFPVRESAELTVFRLIDLMNGVGSLFPPVALSAHDRRGFSPCARHVAFWLKPISTFGLSHITMFIKSSLMLAMPFDPSSCSASVLAEMRSLHSLRTNPTVQAGVFCRNPRIC